ncbi:type II secretion system protein GspM [Marinobacter gelidimuriae]|uniref:type II secretion system protein GspM n=1 Tax=Marinobacter gelidimuriae TaxID=2739064 RepID=UPI00039A843B|nr:type II secretion system protein GspM [Marinobacter gelidimuriae]
MVDLRADSRALMGLVTRSARESGLVLQRFEPSGDNSVRIWMDNVPFPDVASWLEILSVENGVLIDQAALEKTAEGGQGNSPFDTWPLIARPA